MSGIYIGMNAAAAEQAAQKLKFAPDSRHWTGMAGPVAFAVTRMDSPTLWSPAYDARTGVQVLLGGRVAFEEADWRRAETLPFEGGLACRLLIELWLKSPAKFVEGLNGAFGIVIHDSRDETLHVFTDRLGVFPFYQRDHASLALCTHPDVLADLLRAENQSCDFDETTLAEFIATNSAVQPFTYYRQIKQLEPAAYYHWDLRSKPASVQRTTYWQPAHLTEGPSHDADAMAEELAKAISNSVRRRTQPCLGRVVVLLSGGADSRCAVFGAVSPHEVNCVTLCDEPNEELEMARRLAATAGARHQSLQRTTDYYAENASEAMRVAGGMWNVIDAHFLGFKQQILNRDCGAVLTGCYADYMLKGLGLNRQHRTFLRRNLPLYDFAPFAFQFYHTHYPIATEWQQRVSSRLETRFPMVVRADNANAWLASEDLRLRPFSREADAAGRLILLRCFPWEPFLADTDILNVWGRMSPEMKINGIAFGKAVGRVIGSAARRIPNNNYGTPVDASEFERAVWFLWAVLKRKARRATGRESTAPRLATSGSWPNWSYFVAHSPVLARLWAEPSSAERELFSDILGRDPWQTTMADWGRTDAMLFMRLFSARLWLRQQNLFQ